jgi:hypothetical protein
MGWNCCGIDVLREELSPCALKNIDGKGFANWLGLHDGIIDRTELSGLWLVFITLNPPFYFI